jgi:hypothetical protein
LCTIRFECRILIVTGDFERLVAATGRLEVKMGSRLEEMKAWRTETTACQEAATKTCLEKSKRNSEKTKANLEEMEWR